MTDTSNLWRTDFETGLLDDYDGTITRSWFAPDQQYAGGDVLLLQWEIKTDNLDVPETTFRVPLGKGWVSKDGGKTIVHESGKPGKYFVKTSLMAKLIERCVDTFGIGELLASRGGPFESGVWTGLSFHFKSELFEYGAGLESKPRTFINAFVGAAEAKTGTSPVAANASSILAAAAAKKAAANNGGGKTLREQVVEAMAPHKANNDFGSAQEAAINIPGVTEDEELVNLLLDESGLYSEV